MFKHRVVLALLLLFLTPVCTQAQSAPATGAQPAAPRKTSKPYTGDLSIFDSPGRDERLQINRVMDILEIAPGKTVADIGAGSGWFTVRAARRVTETGSVYAVDINPEATRYIDKRAQKEGLHNVKTLLSKSDDPQLPANQIDSVLLLKTYHEVDKPVVLLQDLRAPAQAGSKGGGMAGSGNGEDHGVAADSVIKEGWESGYFLQR